MIATTIEQSRHLLELGLDPNTADMFWKYSASLGNKDINGRIAVSYHDNLFVGKHDGAIPAWSLSALLEVMPPFIKGHHLKIEKTRITDMWYLDYQYLTDSEPRKDLLTAAYEMVCWLLEQGFIKKGGNNE